MKRLLFFPVLLCVVGCGPDIDFKEQKTVFTIKKGGRGSIKMSCCDIKPKAEGKEAELVIEELTRDVKHGKYDIFEGYGIVNRKQTIERDKDGILSAHAYGEFEDIFGFIRVLDSSWPHLLRKGQHEKVLWSKGILTIEFGDDGTEKVEDKAAAPEKATAGGKDAAAPKEIFIFKTEGKYLNGTVGQISEDGKTTTVNPLDFGDDMLVLVIGDIAAD